MSDNRSKAQSILIADDNPNNLRVLSSMLEEQGYKIRVSQNGEQVLKSVEMMLPDLIMLDIHMPILDGYDTCKRLKANNKYNDIPVIFVSAMSEAFNKLLAFEVGGIDYIVKPFQLEEVRVRVKTHLALKEARDRMKDHFDLFQKYKGLINIAQEHNIDDLKSSLKIIAQAEKVISDFGTLSNEQQKALNTIKENIQKIMAILDLVSDINIMKVRGAKIVQLQQH